jgi:cell division protein FtsW
MFYVKRQLLLGGITGMVLFIAGFFVPLRIWRKFAFPIFFASFVLACAVFLPSFGLALKGSHRWIEVWGGYTFQPSEFLKIALVLYLAAIFEKRGWQARSFTRGFLPFLLVLSLAVGIVMLEPDMDTAVVIAMTAVAVYFFAGAKIWHLTLLISLISVACLLFIYTSAYRLARLDVYLYGSTDSKDSAYQIRQAQSVIMSGGLTGTGFNQGLEKYKYLPEPYGDSIFAVAAKEFGFIGASIIIVLYLIIVVRGIIIAKRAPDNFSSSLAIGLSSLIGLQAFVNIASMTGLIPLGGITLPFLSYGGTAFSANLFAAGLLLNVSRRSAR